MQAVGSHQTSLESLLHKVLVAANVSEAVVLLGLEVQRPFRGVHVRISLLYNTQRKGQQKPHK